jgi:hypothetical protein
MAKTRKPVHRPAAEDAGFFSSLSPTTQDLLSVALLYATCLILFRGIIFNDAAFSAGGDTAASLSWTHAGQMLEQKEHVDVLWMPYFFSGMPTFGNVAFIPHDVNYIQTVVMKVLNLLFLNGHWTWMVVFYFLRGVFMFLLMRVWKFSRIASLLAAVTFMLSPYAIGLAGEGHGSKLMALTYLPLVFLLMDVLFERRDLLSFGLFSAAIGTLLLTNHMQIVYYVFIVLGLYWLYTIVVDFKTDKLLVAKKTALFIGAMILGLCISSYIYLSVYEYSQFSMRGGGTLGSTGGLTYDYATNWSWSPWELFTLLIPGFFGFQADYYWGAIEPWTNSTVYVGVIPLLLTVFALIYRRTRMAVFMAILTVAVFLISLGRNFSLLYEALFYVLPFFNKFRAPAMILHMLPFVLGILAAIGFTALVNLREKMKGMEVEKLARTLMMTAAVLGGLFVLSLLFKSTLQDFLSSFMFMREGETAQWRQQYGQQFQQAVNHFKQTRFEIFWKDYIKFLLIAAASIGTTGAYLKKSIRFPLYAALLLGILIVDLMIIDDKLIKPEPRAALEKNFQPDATIAYLSEQPGLFRVFPGISPGDPLYMDNTFAYHGLQSIVGYSPAKLKIYQTMLDSCMYHGSNPEFPLNMSIVDMLNTEYLVAHGRLPGDRFEAVNFDQTKREVTYRNPDALPRAFFVDSVIVARNDHEVFATLNSASFDPKRMAVLYKAPPAVGHPDSASVRVTDYKSRRITLSAMTTSPALMVLSEVYYPAGWNAYIDGNETEIYRTNFVLRSIVVPAGTHEIVFSFDPPMYRLGWILTNVAWGVAALCILIGLWQVPGIRRRLRPGKPQIEEQPK